MKEIIGRLLEGGHEAYMVGGAVRDYLLGKKPNDTDIATNARPEKIIELFKDRNVNEVGKSFGVVLVDGIEVATYRSDRYFGLNDKNVKIEYADSIVEDLARRDFTINAMALDLNGNLIDPFGGKKDLEDGIVKFVGDPNSRIYEDPNRIVRACRFAATFKLDRST